MRSRAWFWGIVFAAFMSAPTLMAQNFFQQLVTPGELAAAHAKLERSCESCHEPFSRESQTRLCLICHKDIAADMTGLRGYHGKLPEIHTLDCKKCHTDHKGRGADIVGFDKDLFDHAATDYPLLGAHVGVDCEACHAKGEKFSKAPSDCFSCHEKADEHKGALGKDCAACHWDTSWTAAMPFDHSKTSYALEGAHKGATCESCHSGEHYKGTPRTCFGCHEINDVHNGAYETKCDSCHGIETWKAIRFDHAKDAKWPLRGAHAPLRCTACHKGDVYKDRVGTTCVACHKSADVHKGSLGPRCERCHNETSWRKNVEFDHNKTKFALTGLHAGVTCKACHTSQTFKDAPTACQGCHEDKAHKGSLGAQCAQCHSDTGWMKWHFDHDKQTRYPLTGAHATVKCAACHSTATVVAPASVPTDCYSCHQANDIHKGFLGRSCQTCHSTKKWTLP